ncbi:23S rRNA (adenine(2030)-N(6))-methyltransferase RlmJ [Endothiovibrio diazotrophicus]
MPLEFGIRPDRPGHGMTASGMVVVSPPYPLAAAMTPTLEYLAASVGDVGHFRCVELVG